MCSDGSITNISACTETGIDSMRGLKGEDDGLKWYKKFKIYIISHSKAKLWRII